MVTTGMQMWASLSPRVRLLLGFAFMLMILVAVIAVGAFAHIHGLGAVMHSVVDGGGNIQSGHH